MLLFLIITSRLIDKTFAQCGETTFTELSGRITSPGFPGQYPSSSDCTYEIQTPTPDNQLQVHFLMIDIEFNAQCAYDYLEITWMDSSADNMGGGKQCGNEPPADLNGKGGMRLKFFSDSSENGNGFELEYNIISACNPNPCQHEGTCTEAEAGADPPFTCNCETAPGYTGDLCETEINECEVIPCLNDALCHDGLNSYTCECQDGFEGEICEIELDPCGSGPCFHGGECEKLSPTMYSCHCLAGYHGPNCELENDPCDEDPCLNEGICTKLSVLLYDCDCVNDYEGDNCEIAPFNPLAVFLPVLILGSIGGGAYWWYIVLPRQEKEKEEAEIKKYRKKSKKDRKESSSSSSSASFSSDNSRRKKKSSRRKSKSKNKRKRKRSSSTSLDSNSITQSESSFDEKKRRSRRNSRNPNNRRKSIMKKNQSSRRRHSLDSIDSAYFDKQATKTYNYTKDFGNQNDGKNAVKNKFFLNSLKNPCRGMDGNHTRVGHMRKLSRSKNITESPNQRRRRTSFANPSNSNFYDQEPYRSPLDRKNLRNISLDGEVITDGYRQNPKYSEQDYPFPPIPNNNANRNENPYISDAAMKNLYPQPEIPHSKIPMPNLKDLKKNPNASDLVNIYKIYRRYKQANDPRSSMMHLDLPSKNQNTVFPMNSKTLSSNFNNLEPDDFDKELNKREIDYLRRRVASSEGQLYQARQEASYWRNRNVNSVLTEQQTSKNSRSLVPK